MGAAQRADARRNQQVLLEAAAEIFVSEGIDAPVRDIATAAGVGVGTLYRHFPTRADLVVAVYRHQIDRCAATGPELLAGPLPRLEVLGRWIDQFVDFLVTKHGLAAAMSSDRPGFEALHAEFLDRLVPVCAQLLEAARSSGELHRDVGALALMRAVGNLCIDAGRQAGEGDRTMVHLLLAGLAGADTTR